MAVSVLKKSSSLVLSVESGVAADGSAVYSNRTISKINPDLDDEKAYNFASAVGTLQSAPVGDIGRTNRLILSRA